MRQKMSQGVLTLMGLLLASPVGAQTTDVTEATASEFPPGSFLIHTIGLLIVFACVLTGFKFYNAIKGGRLGRGWLWIFFGLVAFACGQVVLLGGQFGVLPVLMIWVDTFRLVSLALFFVGINQLRKLLA